MVSTGMELRGIPRPSSNLLHAHLHAQTALNSLENGINKWLLIGGAAVVAVVIAPLILPALGIGGGIAATLAEECCEIVGVNSGIAGTFSQLLDKVPVIGSYLNTAGGENFLVPAVTILGGQAAGSLVSSYETAAGKKDSIGSFIRVSSLGLGVVLSLPAILPGIGHGVQLLSRLAGADEFGKAIAVFLGNTDVCTSVATTNGIMGGASTLAAHLPCAIPAVVASFSLAAPKLAQTAEEKASAMPLPPEDLNHTVTPEQQEWVDTYDNASPQKKILMQQWFRNQGFDPDFHDDGTMHLYKHAQKAGMGR